MKLRLHLDSPEEGDPLSPIGAPVIEIWETVLANELLSLFPETERFAEVEVSVSIMDEDSMRQVNAEYRGLDESTDVLAFPLWEEEGCFSPEFAPEELLPLGDVLICPETVRCKHALLSLQDAFCLVLAHGFLHLLAWDHDTPEKEEEMWERQSFLKDALLQAWDFKPEKGRSL